MKRVVPILIFILILILRQAPPALMEDRRQGSSPNLYELNLLSGAQGLGWLEIMESGNPVALSPVFEAFRNEGTLVLSNESIRPIRYVPRCFSNPLLIDRPPPVCKPVVINFA